MDKWLTGSFNKGGDIHKVISNPCAVLTITTQINMSVIKACQCAAGVLQPSGSKKHVTCVSPADTTDTQTLGRHMHPNVVASSLTAQISGMLCIKQKVTTSTK